MTAVSGNARLLGPIVSFVLLTACSSAPAGATCGEGTQLVDGTCVPVEAEDASLVDAQEAVIIETSAPVVPDIGAEAMDGKPVPPDTRTDTMADAVDAAAGDPCPSKIDVNCSSSCGGPSDNCAVSSCGVTNDKVIRVTSYSMLPFVMRTPSPPWGTFADPACKCSFEYRIRFGMRVFVQLPPGGPGFRIRVGAPWVIYNAGIPAHCLGGSRGECFGSISGADLIIGTTETQPPARNIIIDARPDGGTTCP
jgi:hypothetical protein